MPRSDSEIPGSGSIGWVKTSLPPRTLNQLSSGLVVHVDDVDAHFRHARDAGATIDREPEDQPYGQREYGARDLEGHRWWFATPTAPPAMPDPA